MSSARARPSSFLLAALVIGACMCTAAGAVAQKPSLDGRRKADKILSASDQQRRALPPDHIAMTLRRHGVKRAALRADFLRQHNTRYTKELPATPIRAQAASGRCWIFTALNVVEQDYSLRTNSTVKLSRAWVNAKNLQSTAYELLQSGAKTDLLRSTSPSDIGEGGSFAYAVQILDKYGAVPEHVMRDFFDSKNSATAIKLLETLVVDAQERLKKTDKNSPAAMAIVKQAQADIDRTIARAFTGKEALPEKFTVDGKEYTPKSYAEEKIQVKAADYVTLADQRSGRKGWQTSGRGVHTFEAYNTGDVEIMKAAIRAAIDQGKKVYISVPVGDAGAPFITPPRAGDAPQYAPGVMSIAAFDYASLGMPSPITDRETIQRNGLHPTNHAMTITGYDLGPDGKVVKWKVENSWGAAAADHGIQHMYDDFLTAFVGVMTLPKSALPEAMRKQLEAEKQLLAQMKWDPK